MKIYLSLIYRFSITGIMVTLEYNLKKINEMYKFEEGWDGYDANPISKEILDLTKSLLKRIKMQPEVFPVATGGIQLEYEKEIII